MNPANQGVTHNKGSTNHGVITETFCARKVFYSASAGKYSVLQSTRRNPPILDKTPIQYRYSFFIACPGIQNQKPNPAAVVFWAALRSFCDIFFLIVNSTSGGRATSSNFSSFLITGFGSGGGTIVHDAPHRFLPLLLQWMCWWFSNWFSWIRPIWHHRQIYRWKLAPAVDIGLE